MKKAITCLISVLLILGVSSCAKVEAPTEPITTTANIVESATTPENVPTPAPTPIPTPEPPALLDHVVFTDPVLEERVREAMGKPEGDISAADAAAVTELKLNAPENATDDQRIRDISALWYFMNLKQLEFMSNAVTDISPLSCMKQLETLYMSWNQASDISPLSQLDALFIVSMDSNGITDISALKNKQGLVILSIDGNAITDIGPLAGNERLENLSLRGNQVTDLNPLATVPQLTTLMISGNPIQTYDQLESSYSKITQTDYELLFASDIPDTPLVFADAAFEKALRTAMGIFDRPITQKDAYVVQELFVTNDKSEGSQFTDIAPLQYFVNLRSLSFNMNLISDLTPLAGLTKLTSLNVSFNQVSDLSPLAGLAKLERLELKNNQITNVSPLAGLTNLRALKLADNPIESFSPLAEIYPNLEDKDFEIN
ncbi:MAG: leucine-rich repeat domain-containing protein [Christensenella sp.]